MKSSAQMVGMKEKNLLEAVGISKRFGRRQVLRSVGLQLRGGELVGIVGENGSGKSTLLKILVGLLRPTIGAVTVNARTGYCPQDILAFDRLTVRENFRYFATAYGFNPYQGSEGWVATMNDLLDRFHFKQDEDSLVSNLSGGTKQKLNLSIALLCLPDLLILDEPYAGFDWETYLCFWEYAEELRSQRKGILMVSHFVYDRSKFDRLLELKDGVLQCV